MNNEIKFEGEEEQIIIKLKKYMNNADANKFFNIYFKQNTKTYDIKILNKLNKKLIYVVVKKMV